MTIKEMEAFLAVCECGCITQAAKKMYVTSQGLSKMMKRMEEELQTELFVRREYGVKMTPEAETVIPYFRYMVDTYREMYSKLHHGEGRSAEELKVAFNIGTQGYLLPALWIQFGRLHPDIYLSVTEQSNEWVKKAVLDGKYDVGIVQGPVDTEVFETEFLASHRCCVIVSKDHPFAQKKEISIAELQGHKLAVMNEHFQTYHDYMSYFLKAGVKPDFWIKTTEMGLIVHAAAEHQAVGLSSEIARFMAQDAHMVMVPFREGYTRDDFIISRRRPDKQEAIKAFRDFLRNIMKNEKR